MSNFVERVIWRLLSRRWIYDILANHVSSWQLITLIFKCLVWETYFWRCSYKNRFINRVQNQSQHEINSVIVNISFLFSKHRTIYKTHFLTKLIWQFYHHLGLYRQSWQPKNVSLLWEKTVAWSWRPSATKSVRRNVKSKTKKFVWPFPIKSAEKRLNNYARTYLAQNAKR